MTYSEALAYISRLGRFGMKLGTERTAAILDRLGNPERGLKGALIAGTNGKGSTAACLASILRSAGHEVGFMPKPHLIAYTERIQVDGVPISERDFVDTLEALMPTFDAVGSDMGQATEFEMLTAMAIAYLAPRVLTRPTHLTSESLSSRTSTSITKNTSATPSSRSHARRPRSSNPATK
jgi:dihydrofolate synthase/folylpolyglutamate synthase